MSNKGPMPALWDDPRFQTLQALYPDAFCREVYLILWLMSDEYGTFIYDPIKIKGLYFSLYDVSVSDTLAILQDAGLIYTASMYGVDAGMLAECNPPDSGPVRFKV